MSDEDQLKDIVGELPVSNIAKHQETLEKLKAQAKHAVQMYEQCKIEQTTMARGKSLRQDSTAAKMARIIDATQTAIYDQAGFESFTGADVVAFASTKLPFELKRGAKRDEVMRFMGRTKVNEKHYGPTNWSVLATLQSVEFHVDKKKKVNGNFVCMVFDESTINNLPKKFNLLLMADTEFGSSSWCLFKGVTIESWQQCELGVDTLINEEILYFTAKSCTGWNKVIK